MRLIISILSSSLRSSSSFLSSVKKYSLPSCSPLRIGRVVYSTNGFKSSAVSWTAWTGMFLPWLPTFWWRNMS